ncbi:MAG: class II aldolase/adducin family protein [bacterium]|nr:class II aldolase/adducin family protein [bacterium]
MMQMEEGVVKYDSNFTATGPLPHHEYATIEKYRKMLNGMNLIAAYANGLGFGNISQRKDYKHFQQTERPQFIITGTQTGHLSDLGGSDYTRVTDFDIDTFSVSAQGVAKASSETVTHAAIYMMNASIGAVVHIHDETIWNAMKKGDYPSTEKWVAYGTYEMAVAVKDCIGTRTQGILVMRGHDEGVISYGPNLITAVNIIGKVYTKYVNKTFSL